MCFLCPSSNGFRLSSPPAETGLIVGLLLAALGAGPVSGQDPQAAAEPAISESSARIAATYRATITETDVDRWLELADESDPAISRPAAVERMLLTEELAKDARRLGLDRRPWVRLELERAHFRLLNPLLKKAVASEVRISDEEVEARYRAIKDTYARPRRLRLRNIFKRFPPNADVAVKSQIRRQMTAIRARVLAGESFAALAEIESDSQTRLRGGLLGNVRPGTLRAEVDAVAMAMGVGEVSDILTAEDGLTLLYCERILDAVIRSPEELRGIARDQLKKADFQRRWQALQAELAERARPEIAWQSVEDDGPLDADAIMVRYPEGRLTVAEVATLVRSRGSRGLVALRSVPRARVESAVGVHLRRKTAVREALTRGLFDGDTEQRWYWRRLEILSNQALASLIQERLAPVTDQEMRIYFERFKDDFKRPAYFQLTLVALPIEGRDLRRVYELGHELRHRVLRGELSLEQVARRHSVHESAVAGGASGWLSRVAVPKRFGIDFLRELLRLSPGRLGKWVQSEGFLWLFRLDRVEPPRLMSFEEARAEVEDQLGELKVATLERQIVAELLDRLDIRYRDPSVVTAPRNPELP